MQEQLYLFYVNGGYTMKDSKAEKEREYYNSKLIREGIKSEMKKPHKLDWKELVISIIGIIIGMTVINILNTESVITNSFGRFCAEVLIIAFSVTLVNILVFAAGKLKKKE